MFSHSLLLFALKVPKTYHPMATRRQGHLKELSPSKWHIRVSIGVDAGGKRVRLDKTLNGSKAEAQRYLNAALRRKEDGFDVVLTRQSLGAWIDEWLETWCDAISKRTKSDYTKLLKRYLPRELRGRPLPSITATEIQNFVRGLSARGLSPRTVRMAHGALRACLNRAVRLGKLPRNVATLVELPRNTHSERLYLRVEDARRLLAACEAETLAKDGETQRDERWGALFAVLILTGVRPGEALGLQWSDLEGSRLGIRRALVTVPHQAPALSSTKTGRGRVIPLCDTALRFLRDHRKHQIARRLALGAAYQDRDLIFPCNDGGFADCHNIVSRHFKPLLKRVGLPPVRLYDLRHSHATMLLAAGEHPKVVQERLGHSSITLTLDTYTHVVPGMQEMASQRLESLLSPRPQLQESR